MDFYDDYWNRFRCINCSSRDKPIVFRKMCNDCIFICDGCGQRKRDWRINNNIIAGTPDQRICDYCRTSDEFVCNYSKCNSCHKYHDDKNIFGFGSWLKGFHIENTCKDCLKSVYDDFITKLDSFINQ